MPCTWRTADLQILLTVIVFVVECLSIQLNGTTTAHKLSVQQVNENNCTLASVTSSSMDRKSTTLPPAEVNSFLPVQVDKKVVLSCPAVQSKLVVIVTWKIVLRDKLPCTRDHRSDTKETVEGNCTDQRITWASGPDQIPVLQIDPVSITHDGNYTCEVATNEGNFHHEYRLQVLVPPEVTLSQIEDRTAVCKAAAGKPAARISWTPEGDCVTEEERWDNGTVTVQSTCRWAERNVCAVSCSVSHFTGNRSLSIELSQDNKTTTSIFWMWLIFVPIFIFLSMMGSIWLLKINACSKCKLKKKEVTLVVGEDEMQPYASYTEKNNPLYDTVILPQMLQSEVDGCPPSGMHSGS